MILYPVPDVSARTAALLTGRVDWGRAAGARHGRTPEGVQHGGRDQPDPPCLALHPQPRAGRADRRHSRAQGAQPRDRPRRTGQAAGRLRGRVGRPGAARPSLVRQSQLQDRLRSAAAKQLLADAGYGPGNHLKLKLSISTSGSGQMYPADHDEAIQQNFAQVNVDLEIEVFEWNALLARNRQGAAAPEKPRFRRDQTTAITPWTPTRRSCASPTASWCRRAAAIGRHRRSRARCAGRRGPQRR